MHPAFFKPEKCGFFVFRHTLVTMILPSVDYPCQSDVSFRTVGDESEGVAQFQKQVRPSASDASATPQHDTFAWYECLTLGGKAVTKYAQTTCAGKAVIKR